MERISVGYRIRERRRALGVTQMALAAEIGVSPSYVNLIERNKRPVAGRRLADIARALDLDLAQLDGSAERRLRDALLALATDPALGEPGMSAAECDELTARFPAWARCMARAGAALEAARAEAEALGDRLAHDPALADAMHGMLTEITALRSTAEILADTPDIEPVARTRFERIAREQSGRLSERAAALSAYFDETAEARRPAAPGDAAAEALDRAPEADAAIDAAADRLRAAVAPPGADLEAALAAALAAPPARFDPDAPRPQRLRALADALAAAALHRPEDAANAALASAPRSAEAIPDALRSLLDEADTPELRDALAAEMRLRLADALLLPAARLAELGARAGWRAAAVIRGADGDAALACRRFVTARRLGAPEAAHLDVDASGAVRARRGALWLLPRARDVACPFWPAHRPDTPARRLALSGGARLIARAWSRPDALSADMLALAEADGAALDLAAEAPAIAAGPGCRFCVHNSCVQRREPSVIAAPAASKGARARF